MDNTNLNNKLTVCTIFYCTVDITCENQSYNVFCRTSLASNYNMTISVLQFTCE